MNQSKGLMRKAWTLYAAAQGPIHEGGAYEELCYIAHQAVEKAFKGLIIFFNEEYEYTHNISKLLKVLKKHTIVPDAVCEAYQLTKYAQDLRYTNPDEDIPIEEHQNILNICRTCLNWVEYKLSEQTDKETIKEGTK